MILCQFSATGTTSMTRNADKRKLSDLDAVLIRCAHIPASPEHGTAALARMFGVSRVTIDRIIARVTYRNLHPLAIPSMTFGDWGDEEVVDASHDADTEERPFRIVDNKSAQDWYGQTLRGTQREYRPISGEAGDRRYKPLEAYCIACRGYQPKHTTHRLQRLCPTAEATRRKNQAASQRKGNYERLVRFKGKGSEDVARYVRYIESRDGTARAEELYGGPLPGRPDKKRQEQFTVSTEDMKKALRAMLKKSGAA